jgi:predicted TPR repeat methyltransferase
VLFTLNSQRFTQNESISDLLRAGREQHRAGRLEEAEVSYRQALELDPTNTDVRLNLGVVLSEMDRAAEGVELLSRLLAEHPKLAAGWAQLGRAIVSQGFVWEAHDAIRRALKNKPDAHTLVVASMVLTTLDDLTAAESACRRALKMSPDSFSAWIQLGQVLAADGRKPEAAGAFRRASEIEPENEVAAFYLASLTPGADKMVAPAEYVRKLFDGYADRFDGALVGELRYRVPELLDELYSRWLARSGVETPGELQMLDAGCGTGLCGQWMNRYRGRLVGVDLSPKMIAQSKSRDVYDDLIIGDIVAELEKRPGGFDLIVAGDVLVYFGDLAGLFAAAAKALRAGGVFLFSVEAGSDADYVLRPTQRFAHSRDYLNRLAGASGMAVRVMEEATLRLEKGAKVGGDLVLAEKQISVS